MATYTIKSTDHQFSFAIENGNISGDVTGSAGVNTDLLFYGQGSFNWGEGIEQNLLRIMESFASDPLNSGVADAVQVPDPFTGELNKGIKNPVVGQAWFNKFNGRVYHWDGANWTIGDEGRYVKLDCGGTVDGILRVERPAGVEASFEIASLGNDAASPVSLILSDSSGEKIRIWVDQDHDAVPATNVDVLKIEKKSGALTVLNHMWMFDTHTEFLDPVYGPQTTAGTDDAAFTTKKYVDDGAALQANLAGATFTGDVIVQSGTPLLRLEGTTSTQPSELIFADNTGDKVTLALDQSLGGGVDFFRITKINGTGGQGMIFLDTHIETNASNGKIQTPTTVLGDNAQTVTTLGFTNSQYVPFTGGTMTGNFTIDKNNPELVLEGTGPQIRLDQQGGGADTEILFREDGATRGDITMLTDYPIAGQDTLRIAKRVGGAVFGTVEMRDQSIQINKQLVIQDGASSASIVVEGTGGKSLIFDDSGGSGDQRASVILQNSTNHLIMSVFPAGGGGSENFISMESDTTIFKQPLRMFDNPTIEKISLEGNGGKEIVFFGAVTGTEKRAGIAIDAAESLDLTRYDAGGAVGNAFSLRTADTFTSRRLITSDVTDDTHFSTNYTTKGYVNDKTLTTGATVIQGDLNIDQAGTWRSGLVFSAGTVQSTTDLIQTFPISGIPVEKFNFRSGGQPFLQVRLQFEYILRVNTLVDSSHYSGISFEYRSGTTGAFTTFNLRQISSNTLYKYSHGSYFHDFYLPVTIGESLQVRFRNTQGPMNNSGLAAYANYNGFSLNDVWWTWRTIK